MKHRQGQGKQRGAGAVEFVLILPVLLCLLLMILQISLLVQARFVVNYAAYMAARAASVVISARAESARSGRIEAHNQINTGDPASPKMTFIRHAAALPCVAISPRPGPAIGSTSMPSLALPFAQIAALFPAGEASNPADLAGRAQYAYNPENLRIEVKGESGGGAFRDHELITVRVTYRYYLAVPFANRLFGKRYFGGAFFNPSGWYFPITEQYTMVNEGEPLFPKEQTPPGSDLRIEG